VLLCVLGAAWFVRTQRAGGRPSRKTGRGAALLAAGALLCVTGCGQASPENAAAATPVPQ